MIKKLPLSIFISKYFLSPLLSAECEAASLYLNYGNDFNYKKTKFYKLRTGKSNWMTPGYGKIPIGLSNEPIYWVMPWADKYRKPLLIRERVQRAITFKKLLNNFFELIESIKSKGFDNSKEPIKGYLLNNNDKQLRFIYTDGNRRLGSLAAISAFNKIPLRDYQITVDCKMILDENSFKSNNEVQGIIEKYSMHGSDVDKWFQNAFIQPIAL